MPKKLSRPGPVDQHAGRDAYVADRILNERIRDGRLEYCIKWHEYPIRLLLLHVRSNITVKFQRFDMGTGRCHPGSHYCRHGMLLAKPLMCKEVNTQNYALISIEFQVVGCQPINL